MKYQIQIQYTNPSHEHVSLRRRVDTITRIVEASSETEALNRAANQQRSLGFLIKEATVMKGPAEENRQADEKEKKKKKVVGDDTEETDIAASGGVKEAAGTASYPLLKKGEKLKPMKLKEGFDPDPSDIAAHLVKKHGKGNVTKDHVDEYEKDRDSNKAIDKEAVMKHVEKMSEEVEQVDEQSPAEIKAKYYHDQFNKVKPVKAYDKDGKLVGHYRSMAHAKQMKPGHTYKEVKEEVELDEAQKKLKPSYWKAEWRLGTQSEVDKNNKKIFDKLAKTDPVKAAAFHDNLMRMRKKDMKEEVEQVDEGLTAKKTAVRASDLSDKFKKKDPEKSKLYRDVAVKAISRIKTGVGQSSQGSYRDVEGGGNKALRRQGIQPAGKSPVFPFRKEEVEQIDERNMENKAKKNAMATKLGVSTYVYGKGVGVSKYDHEPSFKADPAGFKKVGRSVMQSPKTTSSQVTALKKANEEVELSEASKEGKDVMRGMRASLKSMDLRHGVDSDKREAGYKMSPAVKAAQAKSDALSKVVKRPQAGTLAAVHKSMEREMLKKEAVENNGKQKARKAAEMMVNKAKGKANKINMTPELEPGKPNA